MSLIKLKIYEQVSPGVKEQWDQQVSEHGRMTNLKKTLAHSSLALSIYMQWYPLRDEVESFLGKRPTLLFIHAISTETDCLICSTFFRKILIDSGEDPDQLLLNETEQRLVTFARQIVKGPNAVADDLLAQLTNQYSNKQMVLITALAGMMVATNIVNNVLKVPLDDYLNPFKRENV